MEEVWGGGGSVYKKSRTYMNNVYFSCFDGFCFLVVFAVLMRFVVFFFFLPVFYSSL